MKPVSLLYSLPFTIAADKRGLEYQVNIFLLQKKKKKKKKKKMLWYSSEVPQWGTSNEYPQHVFVQNL